MIVSAKTEIIFSLIVLLAGNLSFAQSNHIPLAPQPLHADGIENFFKLSDNFYSGSLPEGEKAFAELKKLGIKTIITVDGAKPDVETARKLGLRYVHLPFGYDGIPTKQAFNLVKAARELPKPIYIHCHHGMHRGPAGAAVICEATENWTTNQALAWLTQAGTATNYVGLYESVASFRPPSEAELEKLPNQFPEKSEISPLADTMVEIDGRFDNLKLIKKAGYEPPMTHPDLIPAHEALLLEELFKELNRSAEIKKRDKDFRGKLDDAEHAVSELRSAIESKPNLLHEADKMKLSVAFDKVTSSCATCHKAHRN
jgi:protein tyrosine phosphatase (PTP) superfamily phosphohydrolase (DUF442 family)